MSKELEVYFKRIKHLQVCVDYENDIIKSVDEILPISCIKVEHALQRLDAIENTNPSDALEYLKSLDIQVRFMGILDVPSWEKYLPTIKQALQKAQEQEKKGGDKQ